MEPEAEPQLPERPQHPEVPPAEQTDTPKVDIFLSTQPYSIYDHAVLLSNKSVFPSFIISSLFSTLHYILKKTQEAAAFPSFEDGNYLTFNIFFNKL